MNEQTNQLLRELAEKLGTTTEYLWQVLIRQAPIAAWTQLLICGFFIMLGAAALRWLKGAKDVEDWQMGAVTVSLVLAAIAVLFLIFEANMIIAGIFNPEYWALKQILK